MVYRLLKCDERLRRDPCLETHVVVLDVGVLALVVLRKRMLMLRGWCDV